MSETAALMNEIARVGISVPNVASGKNWKNSAATPVRMVMKNSVFDRERRTSGSSMPTLGVSVGNWLLSLMIFSFTGYASP